DALRTDATMADLESKGARVHTDEYRASISVGDLQVVVNADGYGLSFFTSEWGGSEDDVTAWNKARYKEELGDEFARQEADAVALIEQHADILRLLVPGNG
ncbi:MAG: hypothetical protein ABFR89_12875, partial [Actinomycetota bacterium]